MAFKTSLIILSISCYLMQALREIVNYDFAGHR